MLCTGEWVLKMRLMLFQSALGGIFLFLFCVFAVLINSESVHSQASSHSCWRNTDDVTPSDVTPSGGNRPSVCYSAQQGPDQVFGVKQTSCIHCPGPKGCVYDGALGQCSCNSNNDCVAGWSCQSRKCVIFGYIGEDSSGLNVCQSTSVGSHKSCPYGCATTGQFVRCLACINHADCRIGNSDIESYCISGACAGTNYVCSYTDGGGSFCAVEEGVVVYDDPMNGATCSECPNGCTNRPEGALTDACRCYTTADCADGFSCQKVASNGPTSMVRVCAPIPPSPCGTCPPKKPACRESDSTCVECDDNGDCSDPTPACRLFDNTCVECNYNGDCSSGEVCRSSDNVCVECLRHGHCTGQSEPFCSDNVCVECVNDDPCPSGKHCQQNTCVPIMDCYEDDGAFGCPSEKVCRVMPDSSYRCVECRDTSDCSYGEVCRLSSDHDSTWSDSICVECLGHRDCSILRPVCVIPPYSRPTLGTVSQCFPDEASFLGDISGSDFCGDGKYLNAACECAPDFNTCVECLNNAHCSDLTPLCLESDNTCVECFDHGDCLDPTPVCRFSDNTCVECSANDDCSYPTPACVIPPYSLPTLGNVLQCFPDEAYFLGYISGSDFCGEGRYLNAACKCAPDFNTCVECLNNAHCSDLTPLCLESDNICVECFDYDDCSTGEICRSSDHVCVEWCDNDGDCLDPTPVCRLSDHTCVECLGHSDCSGPTPACFAPPSIGDSPSPGECFDRVPPGGCADGLSLNDECACVRTPNTCVECVEAGDCPPERPVCEADYTCGEGCSSDDDCLSDETPFCRLSDNTCVECLRHSDCEDLCGGGVLIQYGCHETRNTCEIPPNTADGAFNAAPGIGFSDTFVCDDRGGNYQAADLFGQDKPCCTTAFRGPGGTTGACVPTPGTTGGDRRKTGTDSNGNPIISSGSYKCVDTAPYVTIEGFVQDDTNKIVCNNLITGQSYKLKIRVTDKDGIADESGSSSGILLHYSDNVIDYSSCYDGIQSEVEISSGDHDSIINDGDLGRISPGDRGPIRHHKLYAGWNVVAIYDYEIDTATATVNSIKDACDITFASIWDPDPANRQFVEYDLNQQELIWKYPQGSSPAYQIQWIQVNSDCYFNPLPASCTCVERWVDPRDNKDKCVELVCTSSHSYTVPSEGIQINKIYTFAEDGYEGPEVRVPASAQYPYDIACGKFLRTCAIKGEDCETTSCCSSFQCLGSPGSKTCV